MEDLRKPEQAERLDHVAPDEGLRRREFLQRTALTAGLAGMASVLPADTLVAEAARTQTRIHLPKPRDLPVDTFVVLMMENRSFDHYLGWMPNADGRQAGVSYVDMAGVSHETHRLTPDWQGCGHPDPDHSWDGGRAQMNGGAMDGFLKTGNDEFAIGYYAEGDLGFIQDAAKAFTTFDHFHCSLMGSTLPNREYMHAAQSYGLRDNDLPPETEAHKFGFPWETTIWNALAQRGISHRYFYVDVPVSALWGQEGLSIASPVDEYYARCQSGTLPNVSFVDPFFAGSAGEGPGASGDEHPHGDVRTGQAFMADVVHAFMESPQFKNGALFVVYDEWGGFYDHVVPRRVPDVLNSRDINEDHGLMGFRIPALAVSPFVRRGHVAHSTYGFESILKMIEYRFGLAPLNRRDAYTQNIARSFDWASKPQLEIPNLPSPENIVSQPCATGGASETRAKEHDLVDMVTSGYLDRLGFEFRRADASTAFREPDKLRRAFVPAS